MAYRSRNPRVVNGIFSIVGSLLLAAGAWVGHRQYTIVATWPSVDAEVTSSRVIHGRDTKGSAMYGAEIEFRYTVRGRERRTPSSLAYETSSYRSVKRKVDQYAPGTVHPIRYNPANPDDIRFDAGYNFGFFLFPVILGGMGALFAGIGIAGLVVSRKAQARLCPACGQPVQAGQNFCPHCAAALPVSGV